MNKILNNVENSATCATCATHEGLLALIMGNSPVPHAPQATPAEPHPPVNTPKASTPRLHTPAKQEALPKPPPTTTTTTPLPAPQPGPDCATCEHATPHKGIVLCNHPAHLKAGKHLNKEKTHFITTAYWGRNKCQVRREVGK